MLMLSYGYSHAIISWLGLNEEMKLDMQRIWKRNMGRDDRCIADNGKEVLQATQTIINRLPFLLWILTI